jgi:hypothetical protein
MIAVAPDAQHTLRKVTLEEFKDTEISDQTAGRSSTDCARPTC